MDVSAWLKSLGLDAYAETFAENGVDAALLRELTNDDLKDLGVARLADRKRLLKAISALSEKASDSDYSRDPPVSDPGARRPVTVLFADLVGFTRLSKKRDAEEIHALLNRYFETVDGLVDAYGGKVDKHIGDSVMALFGAPVAHTDDPLRAAHAAHDIHDAMGRLSQELGEALQAHVGIALGQVVASGTGSAKHREYTVIGDSVNLASRLTDLADPGETLISKAVYDAVAKAFVCVPKGEQSIKGLDEPVKVWAARGSAKPSADAVRDKIVGRRVELQQFETLLGEASDYAHGHTLLVRGVPGIGKTRLVEEFSALATRHGFDVHTCLVLDFGLGKGQAPVQTLVRSLLSIPQEVGEAVRGTLVDAALRDGLLDTNQEAFAKDLLDVPLSPELQNIYEAMDNTARIKGQEDCVVSLLATAAASTPLLVVVEDVHWADQSTIDQLSKIVVAIADLPILLTITSRPEGTVNDQGWLDSLHGAQFTVFELLPLREKETLELARQLAEEEAEKLQTLIARAEGNPLFVEQLVQGAVDALDEGLPDTVQGIVLARMDRLTKLDQNALRAAAVLGQRFDVAALRYLIDDLQYDCDDLVRHRLVRPDELGYIFAHALIREGIYSSLLAAHCRALHGRAAGWFSSRDPTLHAEHLDRAGDPDAVQAYLRAAENERALYRFTRGLELSQRGAAIAEADADKYAFSSLRGSLFEAIGDYASAIDAFKEANERSVSDTDRCRALIGEGYGLLRTDRHDAAANCLEIAEQIATANSLEPELAQVYRHLGTIQFARGNADESFEFGEKAAQLAQKCEIPTLEAEAWSTVADAQLGRGRIAKAMTAFQRCVDISREHGLRRIEAINLKMQADIMVQMDQLKTALENYAQVIEAAREIGDGRAEFLAHGAFALTCKSMGRLEEAKKHALHARDIILQMDARRFVMNNHIILADIAAGEGDVETARQHLRDADEVANDLGIVWMKPWLLGVRTKVAKSDEERCAAIAEAEALFAAGEGTYCRFEFCEAAIEGCLSAGDWETAEHVAADFESYYGMEPPDSARFFIDMARALSAYGRGRRDEETLGAIHRLRDEAERTGRLASLPLREVAFPSE